MGVEELAVLGPTGVEVLGDTIGAGSEDESVLASRSAARGGRERASGSGGVCQLGASAVASVAPLAIREGHGLVREQFDPQAHQVGVGQCSGIWRELAGDGGPSQDVRDLYRHEMRAARSSVVSKWAAQVPPSPPSTSAATVTTVRSGQPWWSGEMLTLWLKTLAGSYERLTAASRRRVGAGKGASRTSPSKLA
jgi:hypothetical protein